MRRFINLGLPSGTRWADQNERNQLPHGKAVRRYGLWIPTSAQWAELIRCCTWTWNAKTAAYTITGPNGKSISLPARGFICCAGPCHAGEGHYWALEDRDASTAYNLFFDSKKQLPSDDSYKVLGMSLRIVKPSKK